MPQRIETGNIIISEGTADEAFLRTLFDQNGVSGYCFYRDTSDGETGKEFGQRLAAIRAVSQGHTPSLERLIIVRDSNGDPISAFQAVRNQLIAAKDYGVPKSLQVLARSARADLPSVAVVTIPLGAPGSLEDVIFDAMKAARPDDGQRTNAFIEASAAAAWIPGKKAKSRMAAMVAITCQDDPSSSASTLWRSSKGFVPLLTSPTLVPLVDVFKNLLAAIPV